MSVVTPVLNGVRTIAATLDSVRAQSHPRVEHVVVDGGSTDGTLDLLRARPDVVWLSAPDGGMYEALNRGFERASGDVLASLNADDRYATPDALARAVAALEAHPEADLVYGDYRYVDDGGRPLELVVAPAFDRARLRRTNFVPPHATFLRRALFHDRGFRLDPGLRYAGDWEWFLRMSEAGVSFRHVPVVFAEFRRHRGSLTATTGWRAKLAEWRLICGRHGVSFARLVLDELVLAPAGRRRRSRAAAGGR